LGLRCSVPQFAAPGYVALRWLHSSETSSSVYYSLHRVYGMEHNDASAEERIVLASLER
jgi:hypothetical protein